MSNSKQPLALVLAAGRAQRFGADKRWVRLAGGKYMIEQVLTHIRDAGLSAAVVLRTDDPHRHSYAWDVPLLAVSEEEAERGMGATLAAAARQLPDDQPCLVCLADMPFIRVQTYASVAAALRRHAIVIPVHSGQRGHPVAFAAKFLPELRALDGDRGARGLLEEFRDQVIELPVDDPGIHRDIDTAADLLLFAGL